MSLDRKILAHLVKPENIAEVYDLGLRPEVFEEPLARLVYEFVIQYWQSSSLTAAPTSFVLETQFPGFRVAEYDAEESVPWLVQKLQERYATNRLQDMMRSVGVVMHSDPAGALRSLTATAYEASEAVTARHSRSDMATNLEERRQRYASSEELGQGMTLGLSESPDNVPSLDGWTNGVLPGELAVVGAYSKVGKTMFLVNAAVQAHRQGHSPIIFSLEMPISEIEERVDALYSGVSYDRLSKKRLDFAEVRQLHDHQAQMAEGRPLRVESPEEGERTVSHLVARARHCGADYIIIDQLSFMEETSRTASEKQRIAGIMKQLKNEIGRPGRGKLPCLLAVQLRRESLDRKDGPEIQDFADAAEVERTADHLLGLSRNKEQRANRLMRLDILGSRRAEIASWLLQWELDTRTRIRIFEPINRHS